MKLKKSDLLKRNNLSIFLDRFFGGTLCSSGIEIIPDILIIKESKEEFWKWSNVLDRKIAEEKLSRILPQKGFYPQIFVRDTKDKTYNITDIEKDHEFSGKKLPDQVKKSHSERQELLLIEKINQYSPTLVNGIPYMVHSAVKVDGLNALNHEPYTDIIVSTDHGDLNVSCKGDDCPSMCGGGLKGLQTICGPLVDDLLLSIEREYKNQNFDDGAVVWYKDVSDMYFKIPQNYVLSILEGTIDIGGPIHYLYMGDMEVSELETDPLKLNGEFMSVKDLAKSEFYFRTRQRESKDQFLTFDYSLGRDNFPIFHRTANGKSFRLVITKKHTKNAKLYKIH